jgi:hypothetical protein
MSTLTPRQGSTGLDDDGSTYYGYDSSGCYNEGTCSWWWSDVSPYSRQTHRRARKNLPPLAYHRWMLKRSSGPRYYYQHGAPMYNTNNIHNPNHNHQQANPYYAQHPDAYGMQNSNFAPPPPAYQAGDAPPPVYQPPQGSTKVAADQHYQEVRSGVEAGESSEVRAPGAAAARGL